MIKLNEENVKTIWEVTKKRHEVLNHKIDNSIKILTKWLRDISEIECDTKYIEKLIKKSRKKHKKVINHSFKKSYTRNYHKKIKTKRR